MSAELIGFTPHHVVHPERILLGFATFLLPREAAQTFNVSCHSDLTTFDNGTFLIGMIVSVARKTGEILCYPPACREPIDFEDKELPRFRDIVTLTPIAKKEIHQAIGGLKLRPVIDLTPQPI